MSRVDPPLAGVLRVVYFLCVSFVSLFVVVTGVFGLYHDPNESITDLSSVLDFGSVSFDDVFIPTDADHFVEQAAQGAVFSVVVVGDQIRYELFSGNSQYEASLPAGETLQDLLDEAGVDPFEIPFVDDSLAGEALSGVADDDGDYERNIMIILAVIASALFAAAVLGLGGRFNPLRAGLLGGGLVVFLTAMGFWGSASNDWLGLPVSLVAFVVLAAVFPFLEDGLPLEERRHPPSAGAISFTPGPSAAPPPPPPPSPPPPE